MQVPVLKQQVLAQEQVPDQLQVHYIRVQAVALVQVHIQVAVEEEVPKQ
jgi:hypothetical protein